MHIQKSQNIKYNPNFGAKLILYDRQKMIPNRARDIYNALCENLGRNSDEIHIFVLKPSKLESEKELVSFNGIVKRGFQDIDYMLDKEKKFRLVKPFSKKLPAASTHKNSVPLSLMKIFEEFIIPVFGKNKREINDISKYLISKLSSMGI